VIQEQSADHEGGRVSTAVNWRLWVLFVGLAAWIIFGVFILITR